MTKRLSAGTNYNADVKIKFTLFKILNCFDLSIEHLYLPTYLPMEKKGLGLHAV